MPIEIDYEKNALIKRIVLYAGVMLNIFHGFGSDNFVRWN